MREYLRKIQDYSIEQLEKAKSEYEKSIRDIEFGLKFDPFSIRLLQLKTGYELKITLINKEITKR
jgi:hypothetical protein